jgi:predicted AAA+ superfamily ATPase
VATGSSALELANGIFETAAGRVFEYRLYPFSFGELVEEQGGERIERRLLESRLVWGAYPEVVTAPNDARRILESIVSGALYKDILSFGGIRKSDVLGRLVQSLALQVGSEVSYGELAASIGINKATVETYIDLLEKTFVVFRLPSLARNARNEIKKGRKVYFWDNGIRNAVIGNFSSIALRTDVGALWENYLVSERRKMLAYSHSPARSYFWRTTTQSEVDYVEERDGCLAAYEFKWSIRRKPHPPASYLAAYPQSGWQVITPENYHGFLTVD